MVDEMGSQLPYWSQLIYSGKKQDTSRLLVDGNAELNLKLTESDLNLYTLFPLPLLYYCSSFYHLKFVEKEAENLTFLVK